MKAYRIEVNAINTAYEGTSEENALENYAIDAGYKSYADLVSEHGEVDLIEEIGIERRMMYRPNGEMVTTHDDYRNLGHGIEVKVTFSDGSEDYVSILDLEA